VLSSVQSFSLFGEKVRFTNSCLGNWMRRGGGGCTHAFVSPPDLSSWSEACLATISTRMLGYGQLFGARRSIESAATEENSGVAPCFPMFVEVTHFVFVFVGLDVLWCFSYYVCCYLVFLYCSVLASLSSWYLLFYACIDGSTHWVTWCLSEWAFCILYIWSFFSLAIVKKVKQNQPCNRLWRPIGLLDFDDSTFSRQ
jgi:hypothetical protein